MHSVLGRLTTTATDGSAKHLRYVIRSGDLNQTFSIDSDGNVILMKRLDRETLDVYNLELTLQTKVNMASNASARLLIQVEDVNDNWPTFDRKEYLVTVPESLVPGFVIMKLNAIDRDAGVNGSVTYELMSGDVANAIMVDHQTGALSLRRSILGIGANELRLIVRASDGGIPPRTSIAGVVLQVQRENTSAPIFPVDRYIGWVSENAPVGTLVLKVKGVTVAGSRSLSNFTYAITAGNEGQAFIVDPISGEIRTSATLDYEQKTSYRLTVVVSDTSGRWANTSAQVLVRGVDEYAPTFTQSNFVFQTSYDSNEGEILGAVYASDRDSGSDGRITYMLKDPTPYFRIHPQTGVMSVVGSLSGLQDPAKPKPPPSADDPSAPMTDVKSVYLTVLAYSGPDAVSGKSNTTNVEIQVGRFSKSATGHLGSASTIISISVALIVLLIFILVVVAVKLRRRDTKPHYGHKVAMAKQTSRSRKNRQLLKTNDIIQPCPKAATRAASGFHVPDTGSSLRPNITTGQVHLSGTTICNTSTKSSGRGSLAEDAEGARGQQAFRVPPDSGIHLYADDNGSVISELPSTQEYLTSLGVEASASKANGVQRHRDDSEYPRMVVSGVDQHGYEDVRRPDRDDEDTVDVQDLIYSKVNEVLADEKETMDPLPKDLEAPSPIDGTMDHYASHDTSGAILSPRTSWPVPLPNWGPSYQPLTQVFSEIAKIKSDQDTLRRRKEHQQQQLSNGHDQPGTPGMDSARRQLPSALHVNGSGAYGRRGSTDRSPSTWAPTSFASPDDSSFSGPYAISEPPKSFERRSEAELEIKI